MSMPKPAPAQFATTRWSLVLAAKQANPQGRKALSELCQMYWYPLYAYTRRRGHDRQQAEDLTQGFFADLLCRQDLHKAKSEQGRFRSYLLACLQNFLANEHHKATAQKRGGGRALLSLDMARAAERYQMEPVHGWTPERLFQRRWALTLLARVLAQLGEEYQEKNRQAIFQHLQVFLQSDSPTPSYSALAHNLGISEGAVKVSVHRLRRRYRELLKQAIAETLASPEEVEAEIQDLLAAVRRD